jgi:hypothetical protein
MIRIMMGVGLLFAWTMGAAVPAMAGDAKVSTVETLYAKKDQLNGKRIRISGKVVKVNNGIMGKNFFHLQDGSGTSPANDLTVTTQDVVKVGDQVTVTGLVTLNRDFGAGYSYPLILEEATVTPAGH